MIVWQFATIAALIGALLISVMVLTNRLGATNALLKRIEEGLVRPQPVAENIPVARSQVPAAIEPSRARVLEAVRAVEVAPVEVAPTAAELAEDEASASDVADRDRRVSYLTVRDLKVISRSGRRSSDTPTGVSPLFNEVFGRKPQQTEPTEPAAEISESAHAHHEEQAVPHLEVVATDEPVGASIESREAVVEELAVATSVVEQEPVAFESMTAEVAAAEPRAAIYETVEPSTPTPASAPDVVAANEDQAPAAAVTESEAVDAAAREEKRRRELLMHAQRRRRRLR